MTPNSGNRMVDKPPPTRVSYKPMYQRVSQDKEDGSNRLSMIDNKFASLKSDYNPHASMNTVE